MATEEARSLLDQLMGGDRNAPLPPGAAVPRKRGSEQAAGGALLLPGKRQKSCFDKDIDPLYTAWGIDVFDLFKNTKSDLGANPYVVDEGAHKEFQSLSTEEQERTGYLYFLFQKLQELVRQCDRTVSRNQDKLQQELQRKLSQRGGQDFVEDVDDGAVEALVRDMIRVEEMTEDWKKGVKELDEAVQQESAAKKKLEPLLEARKATEEAKEKAEDKTADQKEEAEATDDARRKEDAAGGNENSANPDRKEDELKKLQMELGKLALKKQRQLFEVGRIISVLVPLQDAVESQHRNLKYVKSDISTDKTVCDVSGNFMSSRDADERIAAHYAGKQYMGWKLVRDKFKEMMQKYGRYGPPPPKGGGPPSHGPPMQSYHRGGSYGRNDRGPPRGGYNQDRGGRFGGGDHRGGRWERGGGFDRRGPPLRGGGWRR